MEQARLNLTKTRDIKRPTYYVGALLGEYADYAFDEVRAPSFKGEWRKQVFSTDADRPLDLEIGTGNGYFFAHRAAQEPQRELVGIEVKFKPLIQTIRRTLKTGAKNARMVRYDARLIEHLFAPEEINHIFVHHPDPWTKQSRQKHRLLRSAYLARLHALQRPGTFLDFKTDSREYFFWAVEEFKKSPYQIERYSEDLHQSAWAPENFVTHFESIFIKEGLPIYYLRALNTKPIL